ncbi:OmpA family protein [Flammeovirgaceae bacterium SG7u.111]|nr:OmpA family protein [Flammeovirgaceae bacterium SG7u.132]WPO34355.1 OmpA family protein [Flammeovirgaceae bacterium SG7u.111]
MKSTNYVIQTFLLSIFAATILSSCVSEKKFATAQIDAQMEIDRLREDSTRLFNELMAVTNENMNLRRDKTMLVQESLETSAELALKDGQLQMRQRAVEELARVFEEFDTEYTDVEPENGELLITMKESFLFEKGSANLNSEGKEALKHFAAVLEGVQNVEVAVEGHTDSSPIKGEEDNWDLSVDRSIEVVEMLVDSYGVDPKILVAAGKSKYDPVAPNSDKENMAMNRRVEFRIIPRLDDLIESHEYIETVQGRR